MAALAVSPKPKEPVMTNDAVQKQYYLDIEGEQVAGLAGAKASRAAETLHR